ncbi:MerR family transcriptional regulator [Pseudomonas sp. S75]|uniref:MerR family transcriptional regulator n=1 Tax=unclassified Pseudomonas TaxID=196821 RepID=UPI0019057B4D|nr:MULTISPECIES: MerR family transcriptional regulator [unclassified Pseudomonas]MBJ9976700.1 MerR family transcriptional regulator [Pseudomonas sp. S30]MBK0153702.1 MerR family transcriptional regulator [Pseudomonas sp. S75]
MRSEDHLPIGELARRTGVNPVTLRAWERRYGLLIPDRTPKGHRLYREAHVQKVLDILQWLERGASVSQVRDLLENSNSTPPVLNGDWQARCTQLIEAIANLAQRSLDQQLNQAMALYPATTLCDQLLLPLLEQLEQRWRHHFDAGLEQSFFHTWLRSKLGARVYHDNHSLEGPPVLLASVAEQPFNERLWLTAWLLSSSGVAVEVLEYPVTGKQLVHVVDRLQPRAVVLYLGARLDVPALMPLEGVTQLKLLGGISAPIHQERLETMGLANSQLFETPQQVLRLIQQSTPSLDARP